jgi:hypothetical protein
MEKLALALVGGGTFDYVMFSLSLNFFFNFFFCSIVKRNYVLACIPYLFNFFETFYNLHRFV